MRGGATRALIVGLLVLVTLSVVYPIILRVSSAADSIYSTIVLTAEQTTTKSNIEFSLNNYPLMTLISVFIYVLAQSLKKEATSDELRF